MLLIIDQKFTEGKSLVSSFSYMGYLAYTVKPKQAFFEINSRYRAVLIKSPETLPDTEDFIARLKRLHPDIPIFALCEKNVCLPDGCFDMTFDTSTTASKIAKNIVKYSKDRELPLIGLYAAAGIVSDTSMPRNNVDRFYRHIKLTPKEVTILRFLIRSYPTPVTAADILKYTSNPSKIPDVSSVRTHISFMNKTFERDIGEKMVINLSGRGYVIKTPEIMQENPHLVNE